MGVLGAVVAWTFGRAALVVGVGKKSTSRDEAALPSALNALALGGRFGEGALPAAGRFATLGVAGGEDGAGGR